MRDTCTSHIESYKFGPSCRSGGFFMGQNANKICRICTLVKAVKTWIRSAFGNVFYISINVIDDWWTMEQLLIIEPVVCCLLQQGASGGWRRSRGGAGSRKSVKSCNTSMAKFCKISWKHKRWKMLWSTVIYYILNIANKLKKKLCHIEHKECLALFHGGHSQASD